MTNKINMTELLADREKGVGGRMMEMIPMPVELVITVADKQAACDLIGTDTYGKPHWTVDTISECNRVVQAFAKHRIASSRLPDLEAAFIEAVGALQKVQEAWVSNNSEGDDYDEGFDDGLKHCHDLVRTALEKICHDQ